MPPKSVSKWLHFSHTTPLKSEDLGILSCSRFVQSGLAPMPLWTYSTLSYDSACLRYTVHAQYMQITLGMQWLLKGPCDEIAQQNLMINLEVILMLKQIGGGGVRIDKKKSKKFSWYFLFNFEKYENHPWCLLLWYFAVASINMYNHWKSSGLDCFMNLFTMKLVQILNQQREIWCKLKLEN
jgi:hypothetical protein